MIRFLFVRSALLVAAAGCDREPCSLCGEEGPVLHRVTVSVSCPAVRTKGADELPSLSESNIVRCLLYVFDPSGAFVGRYDSTDGNFDFYLTGETYDFVAVANKADLPRAPVSRTALLSETVTLAEQGPGCFVMTGALDGQSVTDDTALAIEVSRLVGKVSFTLRTAFTGTLSQEEFVVEDIFLTNVAGETDLGLSAGPPAASGCWYNRMGWEEEPGSSLAGLLCSRPGQRMAASDSLVSGPVFYACPNTASDSHDRDRFSPRCTRFVVKARLGDRTFYYPVTLDAVRSNTHYRVDLTVSGYGLEHPEDNPDDYRPLTVVVTVSDWVDGGEFIGTF